MENPWEHVRIPEEVPPASLPKLSYDSINKAGRIGTGGDADVYKATVEYDGTTYPIAVKEPRFEGTISTNVIEQFQQEAETWTTLDEHANIVTVYSYDDNPLPWIALEYMDGGTVETRIGKCTVSEALWLGGRIAEAVRHGHRHGIAHLDLKPTNILLRETPEDTWPFPKVSDWGLAKLLLEHSGSIEGISPTYAAPEQFDPDGFGTPNDMTDIYQLGAVVYALLTGRPPFTGPSTAIMQSVLTDSPEPPSAHNSSIPGWVDDAVLKALSKEKRDRYEAVVLFRQTLDELFERYIQTTSSRENSASSSASTGLNGGSEVTEAATDQASETSSVKQQPSSEASSESASLAKDAASATDRMSAEQASQSESRSPSSQEQAVESSEKSVQANRSTEQGDSSHISRRLLLSVLGVGTVGVGGFALSDIGTENDTENTASNDGSGDSNNGDSNTNDNAGDTGVSEGDVDVINVIGYPSDAITLFQDYYELSDGSEDIIIPDGLMDGELPQQVGNPMENVLGTAPTAGGPAKEAFTRLYEDEYGEAPGHFTARSYDSVAVGILANVAAGENSGTSIRDQIRNVANPDGTEVTPGNFAEGVEAVANGQPVNYQGASSDVNFNEPGDPASASYSIWEFTDEGTSTIEMQNFEGDNPDGAGSSTDTIEGGFGRTVDIGILLPETGSLASIAEDMINAAEIPEIQVNNAGINIEVDTQLEDTNTDPNTGIQAANSLVNAGVPYICGPASSGVNVPVAQEVFIPNQIVGCSPSSTALSVTNLEDNDYIFRTAPSDLLQGRVMAQIASEQLGAEVAATLYVNNEYGQQLSEQFVSVFEEDFDGTVEAQVAYNQNEDSYTPAIQEILGSN